MRIYWLYIYIYLFIYICNTPMFQPVSTMGFKDYIHMFMEYYWNFDGNVMGMNGIVVGFCRNIMGFHGHVMDLLKECTGI